MILKHCFHATGGNVRGYKTTEEGANKQKTMGLIDEKTKEGRGRQVTLYALKKKEMFAYLLFAPQVIISFYCV